MVAKRAAGAREGETKGDEERSVRGTAEGWRRKEGRCTVQEGSRGTGEQDGKIGGHARAEGRALEREQEM